MNVLISATAFLVAIGVLVAVHEYGHYIAARKLGVKVLRFSIGFGRPLWLRRAGPEKVAGSVMYSTARPCRFCERAAAQAGVARMIQGAELNDLGAPRP